MNFPSTRDTGVAKLPGLPSPGPLDAALRAWVTAATERMEVREGIRGNPWERAVTVRDLAGPMAELQARVDLLERQVKNLAKPAP